MASTVTSWEEYAQKLEQALLNSVNTEGFLYSQISRPDGTVTTFRSAEDIRTQLNLANTMVSRSRGLGSLFFGECAP